MLISIKSLTGSIINVEVEQNTTVREIKEQIYQQTGILPSNQSIIIAGNTTIDHLTVADYNMTKIGIIHLIRTDPNKPKPNTTSHIRTKPSNIFAQIQSGKITPTLETMSDHQIQYSKLLNLALTTWNEPLITLLLDLIRSYSPDDILQNSPEFYKLMQTSDVLLIVNERYVLNQNHAKIRNTDLINSGLASGLLYDGAYIQRIH